MKRNLSVLVVVAGALLVGACSTYSDDVEFAADTPPRVAVGAGGGE